MAEFPGGLQIQAAGQVPTKPLDINVTVYQTVP